MKNYENENKLAQDAIIASVGTLLDEDYRARDFEKIIGWEKPYQAVCTSFINYVKSLPEDNSQKYVSKENFNEYFLERKNKNELEEAEAGIIDVLFEQIASNKASNNQGLKEPGSLYKRLEASKKREDFQKRIRDLCKEDTFSRHPCTWGEDYVAALRNALSDALDDYDASGAEDALMLADDLVKYYGDVLNERENGIVYSFHFPLFDKLFPEGPTPGHGGIIGGSTGMGKSALCLNLVNALINADIPTMYFPIEMGVENTMDRLASMRTHIPFKDIVKIGRPESVQGAKEVILNEIQSLRVHENFALVNDANINMKKLRSYIKRFQAKLPGRKYCIVIIDLLLMIEEFYADEGNMAQMIEKAINKLDILSKELGFHYIGVVQLNRSVESEKVNSLASIDKLKPTRSSIKNSNALLERARYFFSVFRKRYFAEAYLEPSEYETIEDVMEIQLLKANDSSLGRAYANYEGSTFTVTEAELAV